MPAGNPSVLSAAEARLPTEQRLLLAAERMFAASGIGAVSLRSIMSAANANVAAVHYHFGSKDELVSALLRDRTADMHERRVELIRQVRERGAPTLGDVAAVLARPVFDLVAGGGGDYVRVLGELMSRPDAAPGLREAFAVQETAWDELYADARPGLSATTRAFRIGQALALAIRVLGESDGYATWLGDRGAPVGREDLYDLVVAAMTGLMGGSESID